jgi:hypothetical protein
MPLLKQMAMKMTLDRAGPPSVGLFAGRATCYSSLRMNGPEECLVPAHGASKHALVVVRSPDMLALRFDWAATPPSPR